MLAAVMVACNSGDNTEKMKSTCEEQIRASLDYPDELKIISVSEPDSAFGVNYFSMEEMTDIAKTMQEVSDKLVSSTNGMTTYNPGDFYVNDLASRQLAASATIGKMVMNNGQKGKFSGWKMVVEYQTKGANGIEIRGKRWLFFTKDGSSIFHTFDIPEV